MSNSIRQNLRRVVSLLFGGIALILLGLLLHLSDSSTRIAFAIALVSMLLALVQTLRLRSRLTRLLEQITESAAEMSRGNLERTIAVDTLDIDEVRGLAEAINAMAMRAKSDIAEMKRLERVRSEFLGNVSHELRTPIFSVQGYIETLIDGAMDDPDVRYDFLNKAYHNVLRLHSLLTDLIEISRIESGEMKMSFRYFNAADHFHSVVEELRPTAEMAGIELCFKMIGDDDDSSVLGDRERLKQVIVNLVENAIKYNRPDGSVTVELELQNGDAIVRVRDTGIGISKEDLKRIFERFYRVSKDRSRAVGGSGLGLAIVKHILEAHRTQINVESEPGAGSVFTFRLKR